MKVQPELVNNKKLYAAVNSTSGTAIDFTNIPAWAKRITLNFMGVSLSGTDYITARLGSGSVVTTGYSCGVSYNGPSNGGTTRTDGFGIENAGATVANHGSMTFVLADPATNTWICTGITHGANNYTALVSGSIALSGVLDRLRLAASGSNTFDAGKVSLMVEG